MSDHFAATYASARAKFRAAAEKAGATMTAHVHPEKGPDGDELTTDVARFGPADAERVVFIVSGTHGLEGLAGSGCQAAWIKSGGPARLPEGVAAVAVHMLNPWGCAWSRRQTEDNVDLNRNFLDFSEPLPQNDHYEALRPALRCPAYDGPLRDQARADIAAFRAERGERAYICALFQGQYADPTGIGFGGQKPTWSNRTFRQIVAHNARTAKAVALIDFHTGLGPFGHGMLINTNAAGSQGLALAKSWYGHDMAAVGERPEDIPYEIKGDLCGALERMLGNAVVVPTALEYGTFEVERLLSLQIDDCWLMNHGDVNAQLGRRIREELRRFFYPATAEWLAMIEPRALQVIGQAIAGMARL